MGQAGGQTETRPQHRAERALGGATLDADSHEYIAAARCNARPMCRAAIGRSAAVRVSSRKMDRVQALFTGKRTLS